jgi:hypothetical protein
MKAAKQPGRCRPEYFGGCVVWKADRLLKGLVVRGFGKDKITGCVGFGVSLEMATPFKSFLQP